MYLHTEAPVVVYNDEVCWEDLQSALDGGAFDSGATLGSHTPSTEFTVTQLQAAQRRLLKRRTRAAAHAGAL